MNIKVIAITAVLINSITNCINTQSVYANETENTSKAIKNQNETVEEHSDSYWKNKLNPLTYQVTRCSATELPYTGKYWNEHSDGTYVCSNCGAVLFNSKDKFDSKTGWPSFTRAQSNSITIRPDLSLGMKREEVICKHCGAHLGHLFEDGPLPTRQRFCINSAALDLDKNNTTKKAK